MSKQGRLFWMALKTVLGIRPQGFFIPYRYADSVPPLQDRVPFEGLRAILQACEPQFGEVLEQLQSYADDLAAIGDEKPPQPRWRQDWFPRLDAQVAYTLVRTQKPKRIVEVGSGHSTRFLARAAHDGNLDIAITAIDPAPRADIGQLGVTIVQNTVQSAGLAPFAQLQAGDVLSIDSSHILMPGSDVDFVFNAVLPSLPSGVMVHIHDIFLPDSYPASWEWRGYNEQLAVATLLQGQGYDVLWSSQYVLTRMKDDVDKAPIIAQTHLPDGAFESSLWLRKT